MGSTVKKVTSFENLNSAKDISQYLHNVLGRPSKSKGTTYLYRYTKIHHLIDMLKTGYMRLGSCTDMNDEFETAVLDRHGKLNRLFYACFTKVEESLAMYKLYGVDQDSVIFRISYADLERFIIDNSDVETEKKGAPIHNFNILYKNNPTPRFIKGMIYCSGVGYIDPVTNEIFAGKQSNSNISAPFTQPELAGKVKYKCWNYEEEVRLCGELSTTLDEKECIAVKVPNCFESMITITLCPGFDMVKNQPLLLELRMHGIRFSQSVYDPIYSSFLERKTQITESINMLTKESPNSVPCIVPKVIGSNGSAFNATHYTRMQLGFDINLKNVGDVSAINICSIADIQLQLSLDPHGNKKMLSAALLPSYIQSIVIKEDATIHIHFETSEIKALVQELNKSMEMNWERLKTNPTQNHIVGALLVIRVFYKNIQWQWYESSITYEIPWLEYINPPKRKTHNINENTIPPKELHNGDSFKAVLCSNQLAPFSFKPTTSEYVKSILHRYINESPWLTGFIQSEFKN